MGAGVFNLERVLRVRAVDQQQEVNRSSHLELVAAVHLHLMGLKIDAVGRPAGKTVSKPVASVVALSLRQYNAQLLHELQ